MASRRAGGLVDTGPPTPRCAALPCPSVSCHPAHSIRFPDVFSRFTGTSKPAGCRASGWPLGPSVRPSAAAPCRQEHPFPSGRRMHACRLPPAGKDLDLTVSPSWEGRPSLASGHAVCLPALPGRFAWSSSSFPAGRCLGRAENLGRARGPSWVVPSIPCVSLARHRGLFVSTSKQLCLPWVTKLVIIIIIERPFRGSGLSWDAGS